ncbi:MAG: ABC transporter permease, partial [Catenulispora sp.]|nr:ABC transporter permease [Catenulispora sp.]
MKHLARPAGVALAAVGIQAVMVFAFTAPAAHTAPHKVPLAVSAPAPARAAIEQRLELAAPGAFSFHEVGDEAAARAALVDREAYGAIVADAQGPHMLVASAASPAVAAMLTEVGSHLAPDASAPGVTDVVPASSNDPHGGAFTSMVLPLVMSSLIGGVLITLKLRRLRDRALA